MNSTSSMIPSAIVQSPVLSWVAEHWLLTLLVLLAVAILLFTVIIPLFFRLLRHSRNAAEAMELKKDLMIWKNLATLVQGGEKGQEARLSLSGKLRLMKLLFQQGVALLRSARRRRYDLPWFVLVGEPRSGKSTLLKNSTLEFNPSVPLKKLDGGGETSVTPPLCCWLGSKSYIIEPAGTVFFDRWLHGSSAEWDYLIKLLCRFHRRRPLDGVLIAVPADALITDDEALTRQKASLISAEISRLLLRTGMHLPCQVVVTKMDMLLGFREFFERLPEEKRGRLFGWQNPAASGRMDNSAFDRYWQDCVTGLRDAVPAMLAAPELFHGHMAEGSRMDSTGRCYLFPDSFEAMRRNLELYLNSIFAHEGWRGNDQARLDGLFFTSAEDMGVVLDPAFAELQGRKPEEAVITGKPRPESSYFIHDLLRDFILRCPTAAFFTAGEQFKRQLPGFLMAFVIMLFGVLWLTTAVLRNQSFNELMAGMADYYHDLGAAFDRGGITQSPLVDSHSDGRVHLLNDSEMAQDSRYSRMQFFYDAKNHAEADIKAPVGFKLAAHLRFGWNANLGYPERQYVMNQIQTEMVYLPLVRAVQQRILLDNPEPFDKNKREAMFDFEEIVLPSKDLMSDYTPVSAFLLYLFPDIGTDTLNLLSSYNRRYDKTIGDTNAKIIYELDYAVAQKKWFAQFFEAWKQLEIYHGGLYPQVRDIITSGTAFDDAQEKLEKLATQISLSPAENGALLQEWHQLLDTQQECVEHIREAVVNLLRSDVQLAHNGNALQLPGGGKRNGNNFRMMNLLQRALADYRNELNRDRDDVLEYINSSASLIDGRGGSSYFRLENQAAVAIFTAVESRLDKEHEHLRKEFNYLSEKHYFTRLHTGDKEDSAVLTDNLPVMFNVLHRIGEAAGALVSYTPPSTVEDFHRLWREQQQRIKSVSAEFDAVCREYANVPHARESLNAAKRLFSAQLEYNRYLMASSLLRLYPKNESELAAIISGRAETVRAVDNTLALSASLADESIGKVKLPVHYDPEAAAALLTPYSELVNYFAGDKNSRNVFAALPDFPKVEKAIRDYMDEYIHFWGSGVDSIQRHFDAWSDFRSFCGSLKPYEVNTLLFTAYKNSADVLSRLPESILTEDQKKERLNYLTVLSDRMQILTAHYSEICARQTASWAFLPEDPEEAFRKMQSMSPETLRTSYLAVVADGAKGDIPWWSNFFTTGSRVLKTSAGKRMITALKESTNLFRFPLCADSLDGIAMTMEELRGIASTLAIIGFAPSAAENGTAAVTENAKNAVPTPKGIAFDSLGVTDSLSAEECEWGKRILAIADAASNAGKPLVWTLGVPSAQQRRELHATSFTNMPQAAWRYRYVEVYSEGKALGVRQHLTGAAETTVARGNAADADLELRFFAFANDESPVATATVPGRWAALRLYLTAGTFFTPENKKFCVPLVVRDRYDSPSILWLTMAFNKKLPSVTEWPSLQNCPDFSRVQNELKRTSHPSREGWMRLIESGANTEEILNELLTRDAASFPRMELFLDGACVNCQRFFAKNRYVEVSLPGLPTVRTMIEKREVLLGRLELNAPSVRLSFFPFADGVTASAQAVVDGPYAPLALLGSTVRQRQGDSFLVRLPVAVEGQGSVELPLRIRFTD